MSLCDILYVNQGADHTDTVARNLQNKLALSVRTMSLHETRLTEELGEPACIVYASCDDATEVVDHFEMFRSIYPSVPFVLVVSPDSKVALGEILDADRTAVVRMDDQILDVSILANRVQSLIDSSRREEELRRTQARFETLFENRIHPIVEVAFDDREPIVQQVNQIFEEVFGYDESEIQGESLDSFVVPPDKQAEATELNDRVLDGEAFSVEVTRETADGTKEFLLQNIVHPEMPGEFAMYTDITERKQRERELHRQNERLERFASVVSHDLRNPLNVATTRLTLAQDDCSSSHLDAVERAHKRMESLIESTLTLAREGAAVVDPEPVNLAAVSGQCWTLLDFSEATLQVKTDALIYADQKRVKQLLENLFQNAIDHSTETVTITVGDLREGFFVHDDGPGLPEEVREDIFDPGVSTSDTGVGFGLSIVNEIVEAHGWTIEATKSPTGGARFEITGIEFVEE